MKNLTLSIPEPGKTAIKEMPYPKITKGHVLVKIAIAPICIEHQIYRDHLFEWHEDEDHLGHEGVGEIVETTPGSAFSVGDRVIIYQGNPCGTCFVCEAGLSPTHCMSIPYEDIDGGGNPHEQLDVLDGRPAIEAPGGMKAIELKNNSQSGGFGFSQYRIAPENMVQKIPDDLSFRHAALANCSVGCTYTGVEECDVKPGDIVLVSGVGFIGFGAIANALYRGAEVIVMGRNEYRMEICRKMGVKHIVDPDDTDWLEQIHAITGSKKGCDAVFECSGYPFYQKRTLAAARRYGKMYMFGFIVGDETPLPIHLLNELHNRHVSLTGGHDVQVNHRPGLVEMLRDNKVKQMLDLIITHEFNMSDAAKAFEACLSKKAGKVFLYPHEDCPR
jgi:threonine dehydrogenase-like Zn-dependent dehydrogenase